MKPKMKKYKVSLMLASTMLLFGAVNAFAQTERVIQSTVDNKGYVGVLGGANSATGATVKTQGSVGLTVGVKPDPNLGLALFGSYFNQDASTGFLGLPDGTSTNIFITTAQGNLWMNSFHVGAEAGAQFNSWTNADSAFQNGTSQTDFVYGPEAGYDYKVSKEVSLGAEVHYLINNSAASRNNMQALAALKFWM